MSHLYKDYQQQQQEQSLGHGYTHKKFNRVYTHKKLGLCLRQREQENKENRLESVRRHIPGKTLFRPYDLGANTPRKRRISRCFETNQLQSSSQSRESVEENYMPAIGTNQSSPLPLEMPKQNSTPSMYTQQSAIRSCENIKENSPPNICTPPQSSSPPSSCDSIKENYTLSIYAPQSPASSCESLKENVNTSMNTPQSSPSACETSKENCTLSMYTPQSSPLSCGSSEENFTPPIYSPHPHYSPQLPEPAKQNFTPQIAKENSTSSRCIRQSSTRSCESNKENYPPPQSASSRAIENGNMPAESNDSYILRLQRQRASLYMRYLSQFQQLPAIHLQTPMGYPMGYPNVTAPIFNGY